MDNYDFSVSEITATTARIYTGDDGVGEVLGFKVYASDGTTLVQEISVNEPRWQLSVFYVTGLNPNTTYVAKLDVSPTTTLTFTTLTDNPKVALESQWADLASRIKALDARITALENV